MKFKLFFKLFLRKFIPISSFCKECGREVHDFSVSDEIWKKVDPLIKYGHVLCYDCFCEKCKEVGLPSVWELKKLNEKDNCCKQK